MSIKRNYSKKIDQTRRLRKKVDHLEGFKDRNLQLALHSRKRSEAGLPLQGICLQQFRRSVEWEANRIIAFYFEAHRCLIMAGALKKTTGLTGIAVSKQPYSELRLIYDRLLRLASHLPADYTYRKSVENLVKERTELMQQNPNVADIEAKIGQGQIEEIIIQAQHELSLMKDIVEQKPWGNLLEKAPPHQWTWPPHQ